MHERFTGGEIVPWQDLEFELVSEGASRNRALLDQLKNEVLHIAAVARGWHEPADFAFFERAFKIGPLYEVEALALVRRGGKLVGLAGSVNDWRLAEGSAIVHLCSLGLLPEVQARGILPVLMALLWRASLQRPAIAEAYRQGRVYATAISQSPYIVWFL
nr:hypothetical protein [Thermoanaerobaculia bacterium]